MDVAHEPFFTVKKNVPNDGSLFRATSQQVNKTVEQFITRLRERTVYCEFCAAQDEMIRDQVIEKCLSHILRRKLLEMRDLTLDLLRRMAQTIKFSVMKQALMMDGKESQTLPESVNRIQDSRHRNMLAKKTSDVIW